MEKKKSGIKEIAKLAGVSTATVSRVLNGNEKVNPVLSAKVMAVAKSLGYQPSPAARYMRSKKSGLIGIVVPDISLSYFSDIVNGAINKAREYSQLVVVGTVESSVDTEREYLRKISGYMLDGLIHCPVSSAPIEDEPSSINMPLVVAGRRKVIEGVPHITTNEEEAGYLAARYLLNLGRRKIGFLAGFWGKSPFYNLDDLIKAVDTPASGSYSAVDRLAGYKRAMEEFNLEVDERRLVFCGFDDESGYSASRELIGRLNEVDALMVPNCLVARGTFKFLHEQGINVPLDVSIVALDDMNVGELLAVPVTSISHDRYQVGEEAVIQVNRILNEETAHDKIIAVNLNIRQSTSRKI